MVRCRSCSAVTCLSFKLLANRSGVGPDELVGFVAVRLRCRRCGARVAALEDVTLWRVHDGQPREPGEPP